MTQTLELNHHRVASNGVAERPSKTAPSSEPVRLNLGAGDQPIPGFTSIDRKGGQEVYPLGDADESVDEIRASHVLEHFSHRQTSSVLAEWARVLKPGGVMKIAVPDFELIAREYLDGKPINVQGYTMGGHTDGNDHHGAIFDEEELTRGLRAAGLWNIRRWESEIKDCASLPISLNLMGRKKLPMPDWKIECAMSVPRLGFQDNFFSWTHALSPLGIVPKAISGAFWGQCLERVMTRMVGADYILTVDYDTVYDKEAVEDLIRLAAEHPEADALAALQIRRNSELPLVCVLDPDGKPQSQLSYELLAPDLLPAGMAHFGLTLIKVAALKDMPHPWFLAVPAPDGTWSDGRQDDDTYFWREWRSRGKTLFVATHIPVGHAQLMITWPGRGDMSPVHQHSEEFWATGKPENVWR